MAKIKICIDPGHGGSDPGAVGVNGAQEKKANLRVGLKLREYLQQNGFEVIMTRETDNALTISERCRIANRSGADLCISVHHNAGGGDGYDVIHSIHGGQGKELAYLIGEEFEKIGQNRHKIYSRESAKNKGRDYYGMIAGTNMPTVISEFAFIDSKDFETFNTDTKQYREAEAIARAVCRLYKVEWRE